MSLTIKESWELVHEFTGNKNLIKHMAAVSACLKKYGGKFGEDQELWAAVGLIHDFDYEKYPNDHPVKGLEILKERGFSEDVIKAVAGHTKDGRRESLLAKTLYAVDELSGFIIACALVRPEKLDGMTAKSVKKKLKDKSFAAAVDREEIIKSAEDLNVNLDDHLNLCIEALQGIKNELEL